MKRILTLLLAFVMSLNMMTVPAAAAEMSETTNVKLIYHWGVSYKHPEDESFAIKVCAVDELEQFLERYPFSNKIEYDESFFEEKSLLFVRLQQSTEQLKISAVNETETAIEVEINENEWTNYYDEIVTWALIFELDKDVPEKEIFVNSEKMTEAPYETVEDMPEKSSINVRDIMIGPEQERDSYHAVTIRSTDELELYLKKYLETAFENEIVEIRARYDEEFFKDKVVVFNYRAPVEWYISSVAETATAFEIELIRPNEPPAPINCTWILAVELDRDMLGKEIRVNSEKIAEAPYKTLKFEDVPDNAWYTEAIYDISWHRNLMNGSGNNLFRPQGTMTRGMLVTVLWNSYGKPLAGESVFADVPDDKYYAEAVSWAAEKGIVSGVGNNRFNPEGFVTREQMVTILKNFHEMWSVSNTTAGQADFSDFEDGDSVRAYAVEAMKWAVAEGIISGSEKEGKRYLNPQSSSTRAQVAAVLQRYMSEYLN